MEMLKKFIKDESGLETVEYAVMAALITLALVAAIIGLSGTIKNAFNQVASEVTSASTN